ncbi:ACT domain-containing protein [Bifidobacterium cuniculi]|uniref:Amino acid-binding ACT domain protein n=1 Tax=Bifidobacterium cuniculi TaxID=1688 RepID=A0A087ATJ3_9BIFI|nr:ACT domain-containing protein [Bifidobacterium cuniculi]KFI62093.1 amino acid-binding ACT domain protein [Bifidobacterium cuniculi]
MTIDPISVPLSVCKVRDYSGVDLDTEFCFIGRTDEERSLVCPTDVVPADTVARDDGWRAMRIRGELDFSLIGILSRISALLADAGIGIFAISTYNTDYVLTHAADFERALDVLRDAGYKVGAPQS